MDGVQIRCRPYMDGVQMRCRPQWGYKVADTYFWLLAESIKKDLSDPRKRGIKQRFLKSVENEWLFSDSRKNDFVGNAKTHTFF